MRRRWGRAAAAVLVAGASLGIAITTQGHASEPSTAPSSAADAYGLLVDVTLPLNVGVTQPPFARATQEAPPAPTAPATTQQLGTGQVPAGGAVVQNVGVLTSTASATLAPVSTATAQAADVALINQAGTPLISADLVKAQSRTDCTSPPSAAGTEIVNLRVAGLPPTNPVIPLTPAPNTDLLPTVFGPLGLKVILNEQHQAADGRGLVVNAIHIYQASGTVPAVFTGDLIVSHAMSTVHCPNDAGTTGANNPVMIVKGVDKSTATPGDTLTYTATVQNKSASVCLVNRFIDHLPSVFDHVSTSGAFGTVATTAARPGGGTDVIIEPANVTIAAGASATQTFVVKVKATAAPGVYFNNVELLCGNLGNWVKGLDAPVEVLGAQVATTTTSPTTTTTMAPREAPAELPETGGGWGMGGAALAAGAAALAAVRRRL